MIAINNSICMPEIIAIVILRKDIPISGKEKTSGASTEQNGKKFLSF